MRRSRLLALTGAVALLAAACGSSTKTGTTSGARSVPAQQAGSGYLTSVCPNPIQIQLAWYPQPDPYAMVFGLLRPGGTLNTSQASYTGVANADPDEKIEIRGGGPLVGYQSVPSLMYADPSILIGDVSLDSAIQAYKRFPTVGVIAPFESSPLVYMYNPAVEHWKTVQDIKAANAQVLASPAQTTSEAFIQLGLLSKSQVDFSYDFSPARFIASDGKIAQQAFATEEAYAYPHSSFWGKPVATVPTSTNYPNYQNAFTVTPSTLKSRATCLSRVIPLMQKAMVDYFGSPGPINALISSLSTRLKNPTPVTIGSSDFATRVMRAGGYVSNEPGTSTFGGFDMSRVARMVHIDTPVFAGQANFDPQVTAVDLATNRFIDPKIGFP